MKRYVSDPIPLTAAMRGGEFSGADLIFYEVDHSSDSFEALVFLNASDAGLETPLEPGFGFAGSFVIFGHGGCFGGEGHCEVPKTQKDPFDNRPLHALTPQTKLVDCGEALKGAAKDGDHLSVTVLAVVAGREEAELADLLHFSAMRLVTYD